MSKLFYANMARLFKSRIFLATEIFMAGYGIFVYAMGAVNIKNGIILPDYAWTIYFFNDMLAIGAVMAVLTAFFLGADYSDGTIRNKLIIGHTRRNIYLANVFTCYLAGIIEVLTYSIAAFLTASVLIGASAYRGMTHMAERSVYCFMILLAYAAIFSMIAMLDMNKARAVVVELLAAFIFVMLMTQIWSDLQEPEYTDRTVMTADGTIVVEENVPNSKYVSGIKKTVYEWIDTFLPMDQVMYVVEPSSSFSMRAPVCLLAEAVLLIGAGVYFFGKKDMK